MIARKILVFILILFLITIAVTPYFNNYFKVGNLSEPQNNNYSSEEMVYLKTYYLVKKGRSFYTAFRTADSTARNGPKLSLDLNHWRLPTVFYIWDAFTQTGRELLSLFVFFSLILLLCSYMLLQKLKMKRLSILGPILLFPYIIGSLGTKSEFLLTEWWGLIFFVIGLTFVFYNKKLLAGVAFVITVSIQQFFIVPIIALFIYSLILRTNRIIFLISAIAGIVFYLTNRYYISLVMGIYHSKIIIDERLSVFSFKSLQNMMVVPFGNFGNQIGEIVVILGVLILILSWISERKKETMYLLVSIISLLASLPILASNQEKQLGILFIPLVLLCIPLILRVKFKRVLKSFLKRN